MTKLKIVFIGDQVLEVTNYDYIETVIEAIQKKDKWVDIYDCIINLDNIVYICRYEEEYE